MLTPEQLDEARGLALEQLTECMEVNCAGNCPPRVLAATIEGLIAEVERLRALLERSHCPGNHLVADEIGGRCVNCDDIDLAVKVTREAFLREAEHSATRGGHK